MDWGEILHIITDPPHIAAEVVLEVVSYLTIGRLAIWWHDRKAHPDHGTCVTVCEADSGIHGCELVSLHPGPHRCPTCGNVWSTDDTGRYRRHPRTHTPSKVYQTDTGPYEH